MLNPIRLVITLAFCPGGAGLWMCMAIGMPVRSVKPSAEPYPIEKCRIEVSVSNTIPEPIILPEPVLLVTTGTSLLGLKPTALSEPGGESANWIWAACADRVAATRKTNDFFITAYLRLFGCSLVGTHFLYSTSVLVNQVLEAGRKRIEMAKLLETPVFSGALLLFHYDIAPPFAFKSTSVPPQPPYSG